MENIENKKFKPFRETYKIITFAMILGMIYPNPRTEKFRILAILFIIVSVAPLAGMVLIDLYFCCLRRDIVNVIRHSTIIGPFLGGFFKMILMYHKRKEAKIVLDEIDRDYESYNYMPADYKKITFEGVRNSLIYSNRVWGFVILIGVLTFPLMAVVETLYSYIIKSEPIRYMIHDVNIPFREPELRLATPQFEIMFVYMLYSAMLCVFNFIGYDGFFALSINHACMKMEIYCKQLEDAMKSDDVHRGIVRVVKEQCRLFEFVDLIQQTFNIWLGIIFLATMIQTCSCLYHITEGYGFDLRYTIFISVSVLHTYLPCRYAAKLKAMSMETSTRIYCCGWENVNAKSVRNMITFMVARGQVQMEITAFNMLAFDMELFVSIMQTSYSMFTLLRS